MKAVNWLLLVVAVVLSPIVLSGAEPEVKDPPPPPVDPEVIRLFLMDGSIISGKLSIKEIEVSTQFGMLKVPVTELKSFTPGLASHPELGKKVYDLIDKLGSSDFAARELAQKELIKMGPEVRGELEKKAGDPDTERRMRIASILDEFDLVSDDEDDEAAAETARSGVLIVRDTVETKEFTAVGQIVAKSFTISSLYGPLTVQLADIRRGQRDGLKMPDVRRTVEVDEANLVQRSLKDTGIRVERGDKVTITAEGTLTMTPWGTGVVSTPEGGANFGWFMPNTIPGGCLVGVVGPKEDYFKVGSKSTFKAQRAGTLRLGIGMQPDYATQNFPGKYAVKIRVERK